MTMADNDVRESFPSLEDASGVGVPLTKSLAGDTAAGKVGSTAFVYKDKDGNLILPQLDNQNRLPVSTEPQGTRLRTPGTTVAGALLGGPPYVFTQVLSLTAASGVSYVDLKGTVNCRRAALFQLLYTDAGSSVVLDEAICDAGQFKNPIGLGAGDEFTVPASGVTPKFVIQAGNYDKASDLHAALSCTQLA
jgi:hypothetical protein